MSEKKLTKVNFTKKNETVSVEFDLSAECVKDLNLRLETRVKQVNADLKAGIIDKKTASEKLEKLTFDKITGDFIKKIVNALNSTIILTDKVYTINGKDINTNNKRINGKVLSSEVKDYIKEINEFLQSGKVKLEEVNKKSPVMIRNAKYVVGKTDKQYTIHEFISMKNFNSLEKDIKTKISASKHVIFDNITVINQ